MWQKTRHEQSLIADFLVSNSPSVTASRATSPYTGEAFTCEICSLHYQRNSILFCLFGCSFALPIPYTGRQTRPTVFICIISIIQYLSANYLDRFSAVYTTSHEHTKSAFSEAFHEKPPRDSAIYNQLPKRDATYWKIKRKKPNVSAGADLLNCSLPFWK